METARKPEIEVQGYGKGGQVSEEDGNGDQKSKTRNVIRDFCFGNDNDPELKPN